MPCSHTRDLDEPTGVITASSSAKPSVLNSQDSELELGAVPNCIEVASRVSWSNESVLPLMVCLILSLNTRPLVEQERAASKPAKRWERIILSGRIVGWRTSMFEGSKALRVEDSD